MRLITGISILLLSVVAVAGPNEDATLFFDFDASTDRIDSIGGCPEDSSFDVSVKVDGTSDLYGFEFYVSFDTSSLEFVDGEKESDDVSSILEKNGGSIFFNAKISKNDSTKVLVGGSIIGDESSECVSDDGLFCLLTFKHKKDDTTELSISSVEYMDCELESDNTLNASKGIVLPEEVPVIHTVGKKVSSPVVMVRNGAVTVDFKKKTNYRLTAVNTLGKQVYSNKGYSETVAFNGRMAGNKAYSSGLLVVRISSVGNEFCIPLMQ